MKKKLEEFTIEELNCLELNECFDNDIIITVKDVFKLIDKQADDPLKKIMILSLICHVSRTYMSNGKF